MGWAEEEAALKRKIEKLEDKVRELEIAKEIGPQFFITEYEDQHGDKRQQLRLKWPTGWVTLMAEAPKTKP